MIITQMNSNVVSLMEDYECLKIINYALSCVDMKAFTKTLFEAGDKDVALAVCVVPQTRFTINKLIAEVQMVRTENKIMDALDQAKPVSELVN